MSLTDIDILNLAVNWLNETKLVEGKARLAPTIIAFAFCKWLNEKEVIKEKIPKELLERPDLEKALEKSAKELTNLVTTLNDCCQKANNIQIIKNKLNL